MWMESGPGIGIARYAGRLLAGLRGSTEVTSLTESGQRNWYRGTKVSLTPIQCRMARAALYIGFRELAKLANVSPNTVARLERGESMNPRTLVKIRGVLEQAGVEFIDADDVGGVGVRMRKADD